MPSVVLALAYPEYTVAPINLTYLKRKKEIMFKT
jgi:hypothetical protein